MSASETALLDRLGYRVTDEDLVMLLGLDDAERERLRRRLAALAVLEDGMPYKDAALLAQVSETSMFRLRRTWRTERWLAGIAGVGARKARGPARGAEYEKARAVARRLVGKQAFDFLSLTAFAREISERVDGAIARDAAASIAFEVRHERRMRPDVLSRDYGLRILLDCTAVSLALQSPGSQPQLALLSYVVEAASGLILSARLGTQSDAGRGQAEALAVARSFLESGRCDVARQEPAQLFASIAPHEDPCSAILADHLRSVLGDSFVDDTGLRRFGRETMTILGGSIERLSLLRASTEGGSASDAKRRVVGRTALRLPEAEMVVAVNCRRHNEEVLRHLRKAGMVQDDRSPPRHGSMDAVLEMAELRPDMLTSDLRQVSTT